MGGKGQARRRKVTQETLIRTGEWLGLNDWGIVQIAKLMVNTKHTVSATIGYTKETIRAYCFNYDMCNHS